MGKPDKEAMKALRKQRKGYIDRAQQEMKRQRKLIKAIKEQIKDEAKTVPQIAEAAKLQADQVLLYVAALRKYGQVVEVDKNGDYFTYKLNAEA